MIISLGGERMERSHVINYPSLGFRAILDMSEMFLVGWTHFCILDTVEGTTQNKMPHSK